MFNPIYGVFNESYIQSQVSMWQAQNYNNQMMKSFDCAKKLEYFLKSANEIEPQFQQIAFEQCCLVLSKYIGGHR